MYGEPIMANDDIKKINGFDKYEIEEAARTRIKYQRIMADKRKGFQGAVQKEVDKQAAAAEKEAEAATTARDLNRIGR